MMYITKKTLVLGLFLAAHAWCSIEEFRPFRPGVALIAGIKGSIAQLTNEISKMEYEAVGVPTLKDDLAKAHQDLANIKTKLGISFLEMQILALENQFDGFALRFFKTAQVDGVFLYNSLAEKISNIYNNPDIKQRVESIIRLQHEVATARSNGAQDTSLQVNIDRIARYKNEIQQRVELAIGDIRQLGIQINIMTRDDQRGLNTIKNQISMVKQQLNAKLSNEAIKTQLAPFEQKIDTIHQHMNALLDLKFTDDRLILIEKYKNKIQQYDLLLHFLRDPSSIQNVTASEILGEKLS